MTTDNLQDRYDELMDARRYGLTDAELTELREIRAALQADGFLD